MRPTIRLRMTLLYAVVFFVAGALLLSVSYALVRNNLTGTAGLRGLSPGDYALHEAVQREVADDALGKLRTQYAVALVALTGLSVLLGWAVAGRVLRPLQRITSTTASPSRARATSSRSSPTRSTGCSSASRARSPASGVSSPTPRTSCAPR